MQPIGGAETLRRTNRRHRDAILHNEAGSRMRVTGGARIGAHEIRKSLLRQRLAGLLRRDRYREPDAAFCAPALEYLASARGGHARQKTVRSFSSAVVRLISPFHRWRPDSLVDSDCRSVVGRVSTCRWFNIGVRRRLPRTRNRTIPRASEQDSTLSFSSNLVDIVAAKVPLRRRRGGRARESGREARACRVTESALVRRKGAKLRRSGWRA